MFGPLSQRRKSAGSDELRAGDVCVIGDKVDCISDTTVANILKAHGIDPAPDRRRRSTRKSFLRAHWDVLASVDFTTIDVWTRTGLVTYYLLLFMELATSRIGFTSDSLCRPDDDSGRGVDAAAGFLRGKKYLLMDRDTKFSEAFRVTLEQGGIEAMRLPPRSPNLAAHIERFMRSAKEECLGRMIFFGERALQSAATCFLEHYHAERNHQGIGNRLIAAGEEAGRATGEIVCRERLGGLLRYYYREAA
jgi:putative transposase